MENSESPKPDDSMLDIDGEPLGRMPLTIEVLPSALEVFVP